MGSTSLAPKEKAARKRPEFGRKCSSWKSKKERLDSTSQSLHEAYRIALLRIGEASVFFVTAKSGVNPLRASRRGDCSAPALSSIAR